jgi:hypothetical protein
VGIIEQHAIDAAAIAALIRARPDLIAYAPGTLHDVGALIPFEIAQILYAAPSSRRCSPSFVIPWSTMPSIFRQDTTLRRSSTHRQTMGTAMKHGRPYFDAGTTLGASRDEILGGAPLSTLLQPIALDPLTVVDDARYIADLAGQRNLPPAVREALLSLYATRR